MYTDILPPKDNSISSQPLFPYNLKAIPLLYNVEADIINPNVHNKVRKNLDK